MLEDRLCCMYCSYDVLALGSTACTTAAKMLRTSRLFVCSQLILQHSIEALRAMMVRDAYLGLGDGREQPPTL